MTLKAQLSNLLSDNIDQDSFFSMDTRPYKIDEPDADTAYMCWESGSGVIFIMKISVSGTVTTTEYAYDTWANRATASYTAIND